MKATSREIFEKFQSQGLLTELVGSGKREIANVSPAEKFGPEDLVFVEREEFLEAILSSPAPPAALVISPAFKERLSKERLGRFKDVDLLIARNVKLALAVISADFAPDPRWTEWPSAVHPSAVIHESASLHESVIVGPRVVIGANARIDQNTVLKAGVIIEHGVRVGKNCVIHPNVVIGYKCEIGSDVIIRAGSIIGSEGFGYAQNEKGESFPIPQTGKVVIEDRVSVGANNCIDRATYSETRIGQGTKLDNLCHIAHNVRIGRDCLLTAGFVVAGSTKIGDRLIASGQTGVLDHLEITDDVILLHRAGVIQNIEKPGMYAGLPAEPLPEHLKISALLRKLSDMRKRIQKLEKKI